MESGTDQGSYREADGDDDDHGTAQAVPFCYDRDSMGQPGKARRVHKRGIPAHRADHHTHKAASGKRNIPAGRQNSRLAESHTAGKKKRVGRAAYSFYVRQNTDLVCREE